jgi:hypothetical protein
VLLGKGSARTQWSVIVPAGTGHDIVFFDLVCRDHIAAAQPSAKVDIRTAARTKGPVGRIDRFGTDRAAHAGNLRFDIL